MNNTKEYIIDKAYTLFLNKSFEGVSIKDISNAIGLTKGALYHHFRNKEELFMAVVDKYLVITCIDIEEETTFLKFINLCIDKAKSLIDKALVPYPTYLPINLLSLFIDASRHYPNYASKKDGFVMTEIATTKLVMDRAVAKGELKVGLNTTLLSELFFTLNWGVAQSLIHHKRDHETAIERMSLQLLEFYNCLKA